MNKKVLVLAVFLLAVAMLATPVFAVSPKKIPVAINQGSGPYTPPAEFWITEGNVAHGRGDMMIRYGFSITGEGISLSGTMTRYGSYDANLNNPGITVGDPPTPLGIGMRCWKCVIDLGDGNTFEGHMNGRGIQLVVPGGPYAGYSSLYDGTAHAVFQGTGEYQGWTLVWEREKIDGANQPIEAYMLIP